MKGPRLGARGQGKELDSDEQEQLCEAMFDYLYAQVDGDPREWGCRADAVINATFFSADCDKFYADCLAEPEMKAGMCEFGPWSWTGCSAKIAEIEACYTDYQEANAAIRNALTCRKMAEYKLHWPFDDYRHSARCEVALAKCPDLLPPTGDDVPK